MAVGKRRLRTIYIVTAALMVAMIGGYALAATSLTPGPTQTSNVTSSAPGGFTTATISSTQLVILTAAMTAGTVPAAGSGVSTTLIAGTPTALAACAAAPCAAQPFRTGNPSAETTGDYGEQIVISVTQPASGTAPSAFDFSISITIVGAGNPVVAQGYLSTGASTGAAIVTVPVYLFMDLLTTTAPSVSAISIVFNVCSTATTCP